jgi:hypothetical protein
MPSMEASRAARAKFPEGPWTDPPGSVNDDGGGVKRYTSLTRRRCLARGQNVSSCKRTRRIDAHRESVRFGLKMTDAVEKGFSDR